MGNCVRKNLRVVSAPPTSTGDCKNLNDLRESLVYHIVKLHLIVVSCRKGIDECIFQGLKDVAVILRGKELQTKLRIEELQDCVKTLDENNYLERKTRNKAIIKTGNCLIRDCNAGIYIDDVKMLLLNDQEYNSIVKSQVFSLYFKESTVIIEIEREFMKKSDLKDNTVRRRRFSRGLRSI